VRHSQKAGLLILPLLSAGFAAGENKPAPGPIEYGQGRELCKLANAEIYESSGLACGRRNRNVFWTHNDSGGGRYIFAFNSKGEDLATYRLQGAINRDWEDMASCTLDGRSFLLIGDIGDNSEWRDDCTIYVVPEPPVSPKKRGVQGEVRVAMAIDFRYEDGPHNCEALAIDPTTRTILIVTKSPRAKCRVYALPLPRRASRDVLVARAIAAPKVPAATAMDISPDGLRAVILTYANAYEYTRRPGEKWSAAFSRQPRILRMPPRRQGESICYGPDGKTIYLTSEGAPAPLLEVPIVKTK